MPLYDSTYMLLFYLSTMYGVFKVYLVSIECICCVLVLRNKQAHLVAVLTALYFSLNRQLSVQFSCIHLRKLIC